MITPIKKMNIKAIRNTTIQELILLVSCTPLYGGISLLIGSGNTYRTWFILLLIRLLFPSKKKPRFSRLDQLSSGWQHPLLADTGQQTGLLT
jgi:hypothetical protein